MNNLKEDYLFLNIQTNSNLSFSLIKTSDLVDWGKLNHCEYLAIADYYPYEFLRFYQLCKENKIKPLIGIKVIVQDDKGQYLITVYPQNSTGYKDLMRKVFSGPGCPENRVFPLEEMLSLKKNCLLVFSAHNLRDIHYFSQQPYLAEKTEDPQIYIGFDFCISEPKKNIPLWIVPLLLPFFAVKVLSSEDSVVLNSLRSTSLTKYFIPLDVQQRFISLTSLAGKELSTLYTNDKTFCKILFSQVRSFLGKINLKFSFGSSKTSNENKEFPELQSLCERQLFFLQRETREKYENRLEEELKVIKKLGYTRYFLMFNDIVNDLRRQNITVGPGRGSAVSSLVAYLLGITKIDPLEYNLFFERFLNEKRKSLPDIDIDVENQKFVVKYLQNKYGLEKVARVATRQKLGWKNAFKEAAEIINQKSKKIIIGEKELKDILSCVKDENLQENLKSQVLRSRFTLLFKIAEKTSNFYFNSSLHASGIVISEKKSLIQLLPLKQEKDFLISYYSEKDLNLVGLKKYDFLNLASLGDLRETKEILGKERLPKCNLQDKNTWNLLYNGLVSGIPQLDTVSFRELINYFQPQNFLDLVLILALNRPGARNNIEIIWERKLKNQKKIFSSPELNQILNETYGSIVFEEQISQILAFVFECSFAEAEIHRRNLKTLKKLPSAIQSKPEK